MEENSTNLQSEKATVRRDFMKKLIATAAGITIFSGILKGGDDKGKNKANNIYPSPTGYEPYLGEIGLFAFNYAPVGWVQCQGQLLQITSYQALFSLLGTNYGGNGTSNFGLPDLRGRVVISMGQGIGLSSYNIGQTGGQESHILLSNEMPQHNHTLGASSSTGTTANPSGNVPAVNSEGILQYATGSPDSTMNGAVIGYIGGNQAHNNLQPYLVMNYCIATSGVFPSRS